MAQTRIPLELSFAHRWTAEILAQRPMILPRRHFVYPAIAEEVERGALEVLIRPEEDAEPYMATFALGFRDAATPTGVWSMPNPDWLCAASGGYVYLVDVTAPERFTFLRYRPVLEILSIAQYSADRVQSLPEKVQSASENFQSADDIWQSTDDALLLFLGHHSMLAWGPEGEAWESDRLSWEGITVDRVENGILYGHGWDLMTDADLPFALDLRTGTRI